MIVLVFLILLSPLARGQEGNEIPIDDDEVLRIEPQERRENVINNDTVLETFEQAVQDYLDEDWDACIQGFRDLIYKYKRYKNTVIRCRRNCRIETEGSKPIFIENIEDMHFYEKKIKETLCILKCNQEFREVAGPNSLKKMSRKEEWKLITAEHYGYLHICYYQKKYYQEAANAVFTYLIHHPDHKASKASLAFYMNLPQVNNKTIHNLEAEEFVADYTEGVEAYDNEYYDIAIAKLEKSWRAFIEAEEQCRFYCEGSFDQGWHPDFITELSNHFVFNLRCKRQCSYQLKTLNGEYRNNFLVNHFNYLQFAYYKIGEIKKACEAVANYLLFHPVDETMLVNQNYYASIPKVQEDYFTPAKELVDYVKREEYEVLLLSYILEEFNPFEARYLAYLSAVDAESEQKNSQDSVFTNPSFLPLSNLCLSKTNKSRITIIADKEKLGGESRFLIDGLITKIECEAIMHLAEMTSWEGDGYENNKSPHTEYERFEGVTISKLAVLTYFGLLEPKLLKLLLKVTKIAKEETERILQINEDLYITYVHLVCRTARPDSPSNRSDYSHKIHADNCLAEYDGSCHSESPAYVWRDYSSIVYLNDDFQGGNFIFVKDKGASIIESTVRPRCGRMLSFSSGGNNLHGVTAVTKGKRCALGLWFTLQQYYENLDVELAEMVLKTIESKGAAPLNEKLDSAERYEKYERILFRKFIKNRIQRK